jgi:hypothetical protein
MRGRLGSLICSRLILAVIVLAANVGAPFSTSRLVRVFLGSAVKNATAQSVVRVRVVAQVGSLQGFRAVVGCSGGEPGKIEPGSNNRSLPALSSHRHFLQSPPFGFTASRPNPPLRC